MRILAALACIMGLTGCTFKGVPDPSLSSRDAAFMALVPEAEFDPHFARYQVSDPTHQPPGTIVVETQERQLYLVLPDGKAMRYGVSVGDEAYGWSGTARIDRKAEWPAWNPPAEMIKRWPHVHAMEGGPMNPLGARALYLSDHGKDTLYRIHGTNEPEKIGQAVSSGCIRLRNIDVVDLFNRVPVGARVVMR